MDHLLCLRQLPRSESSPFSAPGISPCSIAFLALSHAPPALAMNSAIVTPVAVASQSSTERCGPRMIPIITGLIIATNPGRTISRRAACVEISTQATVRFNPSRPSNSPSISLNCSRIFSNHVFCCTPNRFHCHGSHYEWQGATD